MFTPESLMHIAAELEHQILQPQSGPGTYDSERHAVLRKSKEALSCAAWMERNGISEIANIGAFMSTKVVRGQKVRVRKGAVVNSTHPSYSSDGKATSRSSVVTAFDFYPGYVILPEDKIVQGKVHWVGEGGYYKWTDINNIETL